jgi:hypothetical protein
LKPNNNNNSRFRPRDSEQNGSRVYQLILNSMQILPVTDISKIALLDNRITDPDESPTNKKRKGSVIADKRPSSRKKNTDVGASTTRKSTRKAENKQTTDKKTDESAMDVTTE